MELIQENVSALASKFGVQPEVLTKFLTDASAAEEVKPLAEALPGLQVFTQTDFDTRLANERKLAGDTEKGNAFGLLDKRIKALTGIDKLPEEARDTAAYAERAFREKFGKTTDSDEAQRLRDDLKAAKDALTAKNNEFDTYKQTVEKQTAKQRIASVQQAAAAKLPLADPSQADYLLYRFEQKYAPHLNGEVVEFKDRTTGEVVRNQRTAGPATADELLEQFAPSVVSLKQPSAKNGSGFKSSDQDLNKGDAATMDYSAFATVEDFHKALRTQGIAAGSDKATKLYTAFKTARPELFK